MLLIGSLWGSRGHPNDLLNKDQVSLCVLLIRSLCEGRTPDAASASLGGNGQFARLAFLLFHFCFCTSETSPSTKHSLVKSCIKSSCNFSVTVSMFGKVAMERWELGGCLLVTQYPSYMLEYLGDSGDREGKWRPTKGKSVRTVCTQMSMYLYA